MTRWAILAFALLSGPVWADSIRSGDHDRSGRVVLEFSEPLVYEFHILGDRAQIQLRGIPALPALPDPPRNIRSMRAVEGGIEFTLVAGARAKLSRLRNRLVLDVADPRQAPPPRAAGSGPHAAPPAPLPAVAPAPLAPSIAGPPPPTPNPVGNEAASAASPQTNADDPRPVQGAPVPALPATLPAASHETLAPVSHEAGSNTLSIVATRLPGLRPAVLLPFPQHTGIAAVRRGDTVLLVFDRQEPLDLAALKTDPVFGTAVVQLLPGATLIRLTPPSHPALQFERETEGWIVRTGATPASIEPPLVESIEPPLVESAGQVTIGFHSAGQVITVPDPETGSALLVGTVLNGRETVTVPRRTPAFRTLPTWVGLALEPFSDQVQLQAQANGFILRAPGIAAMPAATAALADAASLTRVFDFPSEPAAMLARRLQAAVASAATSPARARFKPRVAVAQAMVALGLGPEAQAVLAVARADDPEAAAASDAPALQAIAALLAGRVAEADALENRRFDGSDEITLWRAVFTAAHGQPSPNAAAGFAATAPLILAYPNALRAELLPIAVETMARGGQAAVADALLARFPNESSLAFARALRLQASHNVDAALTGYDLLAAGHDRLTRVRAGIRAAELRLATGKLDAAGTADRLDALVAGWRGGARELKLRQRIAELRATAGQFRPALDMLRETRTLFPDAAAAITGQMGRILLAMLTANHATGLKPLDLVAIAGDYADCIPDSAAGDRLAEMLADRLAALDLPGQAAPVLERLMRAAPPGARRARFGLQLARMRIEDGAGKLALDALQQSAASDLSPELTESRGLAQAKAQALVNDMPGALATLATLQSPKAEEMRASLLETSRDWPGALAALRLLAAQQIPPAGTLSDAQQELVLREASAALQAGDQNALAALRTVDEGRIAGPRSALFRLLTAPPVEMPADLPRAARDISLAKQIPSGLQAMPAN